MKKWMMGLLAVAAMTVAAGSAQAATLLTSNFTGTDPGLNAPWTATSVKDTNLNIVTGWSQSTATGNAAINRFNSKDWSASASYSVSGSFIYFTIQAASGYELDLSGGTISFTLQNSGTGPDFYSIRSSIDSYGSNLSASSTALSASGGTITTSLTFPASGTYDNLVSSVTFRIYGWGSTAAAGTMSLNAFSLTGLDVPVAAPEPSTYALVGIGLVSLLALRRRQKMVAVRA